MSAFGTKRTWTCAVQMSAFDPMRTSGKVKRVSDRSDLPRCPQAAFQGLAIPFPEIRRRVVRALQEFHQRGIWITCLAHGIVGKQKLAQLLAEKCRRRVSPWRSQNLPAPDRRRNRTPRSRLALPHPARSRRSTPHLNRLPGPPNSVDAARHPDDAVQGARKSATLLDRSCPRKNAPGLPSR